MITRRCVHARSVSATWLAYVDPCPTRAVSLVGATQRSATLDVDTRATCRASVDACPTRAVSLVGAQERWATLDVHEVRA